MDRLKAETKFWAKVDKSGGEEACWPWLGYCHPRGYGQCCYMGKQGYAYRVAWELTHGPTTTPLGHTCHNNACCNPVHMWLRDSVTHFQRNAVRNGDTDKRRKYSDKLILEIRTRAATGVSQIQIAQDLGIAQGTISRIVRRDTRRKVFGEKPEIVTLQQRFVKRKRSAVPSR